MPEDTFAVFYAQTKDRCLRALLVSRDDASLCEDILAEAYARAWARWPSVSRHPAPEAWVMRTALNLRVSWWRRRRREVPGASTGDAAVDPTAALLADEIDSTAGVVALLRSLPERQRQVVALRLLVDLDTRQTAAVMGIAEGTVTAHMARAMATLRAQLSAPTPQETP